MTEVTCRNVNISQAKVMHVYINQRSISPPEGYLLRKGPGVCHFDFAQEIMFGGTSLPSTQPNVDRGIGAMDNTDTNIIQMPRGFIFQVLHFQSLHN